MKIKLKHLLKKYDMLPKEVKASLWFVVANVMIKGISFITLPIFSRILTTEEYGIVSVYQSWVTLFSIVTTLTIWGGIFNVSMVKYSSQQSKIVSTYQGLAITNTFIWLIIIIIIMPKISAILEMKTLLVVCLFLEIAVQIPFNLWSAQERYNYEYKKLIIISFISTLVNPILGYCAIYMFPQNRADARIISNLIVQAVLGIGFFILNQIKGRKFFDKTLWKYAFKFNIVLVPHYLSMQILSQSDRIMIKQMCGDSSAGIYSVAYNFASLLNLVTNGVQASLTPYIYRALEEKKTEDVSERATAVVVFMAMIAIIMMCFVPELFYIMLPASYYAAVPVIPLVTAGVFFMFVYPLFGSIEFYYGKNVYVTISSILGAGLNVLLNLYGIRIYGFIAAAYTTLLCYILFSVFHYVFMRKVLKEHGIYTNIYNIKIIFLLSAIIVCLACIMAKLSHIIIVRWGSVITLCIIIIIKRKWFFNMMKKIFVKE